MYHLRQAPNDQVGGEREISLPRREIASSPMAKKSSKPRADARDPLMDPRFEPSGALLEAHVALDGALQKHALSESGLDNYTADLLVQLMRAPGRRLRAVDLARGLLISTSSTTRLIDRAEAAGYVEREPDPDDRRAQQIVVTKKGERVALELAPRLLDVLQRVVFDPLTARERSVLTELLVRVRDAAREVGAEEP